MYADISYSVKNSNDELIPGIDKIIEKALKNIYNGYSGSIEPNLYSITSTVLSDAIDTSVKLQYNAYNAAFIHELKYNANVFAAFKAHQQGKAMAALLYDQNDVIVPEAKWRKEAIKISDHFNKQWLKTERNTALRRGRMAAKFKKFEADSSLYPNLRWLPSTSGEPRGSHELFYGLVLPIFHSFWVKNFPGNEWNCKCDIEQTKDAADQSFPEPTQKVPAGLDGNPAFTGQLIAASHPNFKGLTKQEKKQLRKELEELKLTTPYPDEPNFTYKNGSSITIHPFAHKKDLEENIKNAQVFSQAISNLIIKIRVHIEADGHSNPEYEINGRIADLKHVNSPTGRINTLKTAIDQGCEIIVFKIEKTCDIGLETIKENIYGKINADDKKHQISQFIIIDQNDKVKLYNVK